MGEQNSIQTILDPKFTIVVTPAMTTILLGSSTKCVAETDGWVLDQCVVSIIVFCGELCELS